MPATPDQRRRGADPAAHEKSGRTSSNVAHHRVPRLPHERDESADSQDLETAEQHEVMQQAHDDVERGLVDTDRGPVIDEVYRDKLKRRGSGQQ